MELSGDYSPIRTLKSTTMTLTDKVEELLTICEAAENVIYSFHKFRNRTSEEDWEKYEGTSLGELLDNLCDLESEAGMENDREHAEGCAV